MAQLFSPLEKGNSPIMSQATPKRLLTYLTNQDVCPFDDWLDSLKDQRAVAQIQKRLIRVELGNLGDFKSVGEGVYELRIFYASGFRIYFGQQGSDIVILLCGGDKSTQSKDILLAKKYWADFVKRRRANG
ncbi:MAG TPA: type II toxin-antitoxin system RelE/ParE family toxin [Pseudobdellovibrionaceae bacterium]|nr:type II toxin-antitoxin system RelE/ParE family toxin [Pseudobdellovibrionaceae bacterium]